jgi:hypothetical protein
VQFLVNEASASPDDLLLQHASLLLSQWHGLVAGYAAVAAPGQVCAERGKKLAAARALTAWMCV